MAKPKTTAPRESLADPTRFGRHWDVEWLQPSNADEYVSLRAAELQHFAVIEIGARLRRLGRTNTWLEERTGLASGRVRKLLHGHAHMNFRDLQAIEGQLKPILLDISFDRAVVLDADLQAQFSATPRRWSAVSR